MVETFHVPLDPTREFRQPLPPRWVRDESDAGRVTDIWTRDVLPKINALCRKKTGFIHRSLQRSVFQSAMDNACKDFSRRTDNIHVAFTQQSTETEQYHPHHRKSCSYGLILTKLSPVTGNLRHERYCVAEIPQNPLTAPAVEAELVVRTTTAQDGSSCTGAGNDDNADGDETLPMAYSEIIATSIPIAYHHDDEDDDDAGNRPPFATALVEENDDDDDDDVPMSVTPTHSGRDGQRSASERMHELESIRRFLTDDEYAAKRQAILESI